MPTSSAVENSWLPSLSAYWSILLQPLLAYFKQSELPLAPSSTLAGICQALVVSLSLLLNTSSSQKCFLLPPLASLARHAVKAARLLQPLRPKSCSQTCFLLPPFASLARHAVKAARLLQPLWPTSHSHNCLLLSPSASHGIHRSARRASCCLLQPLWSMSWSQTCLFPSAPSGLHHAQANMTTTVIISMDKGESTNPYSVTKSLHFLQQNPVFQYL